MKDKNKFPNNEGNAERKRIIRILRDRVAMRRLIEFETSFLPDSESEAIIERVKQKLFNNK